MSGSTDDASAADRRGEDAPGTTRRRLVAAGGLAVSAAVAGCTGFTDGGGPSTPVSPEATVTIRLANRDDVAREYEVTVRHEGANASTSERFEGVLPAGRSEPIEMVSTFRATDREHSFAIAAEGGRVGRTWDPTECGDFLVDGAVEDGEPGFDAGCRTENTGDGDDGGES